eukprot:330438_1
MATKSDRSEAAQATRILTIIVYVVWNYLLHLSYWYFEDSWLHYYVKHGNYIKLYGIHILHMFTVALYLYAAYKSPGFIQISKPSNEFNSPKYCPICKIIRPRRSKHCYQCGKCIIKYDHHCIFTANCVGANNHSLFVFYLIIQLLFLSWSFPLSIHSIYYGLTNITTIGYISLFYRFVCCLGISFAAISVCLLFSLHIYLVITNQTTYMYLKKYGICQKKNKNKIYDSQHFDPDINTQNNSILSNIILFITNPIPNDWTVGKIHDDITPQSEWLSNEDIIKQKYSDMAGVGCVPLPSFKQD